MEVLCSGIVGTGTNRKWDTTLTGEFRCRRVGFVEDERGLGYWLSFKQSAISLDRR